MTLFVEQPLALPGSAKYLELVQKSAFIILILKNLEIVIYDAWLNECAYYRV